MIFLLNLVKSSLDNELDHFFNLLNALQSTSPIVTKSAFSQARKKLKYQAFIELNRLLISETSGNGPRWRGFRLCAIDGSVINLPNNQSIRDHFDPTAKFRPQARASQLYDVLSRTTLDAQLAPMATGERRLAERHLACAQADDLIIYDRGYPSFRLFAQHRQLGCDFCVRTPWNFYNETRDFYRSNAREAWVKIRPSQDATKDCQAAGIAIEPVPVRLVRVDLPSGETEILITSVLASERIPANEFKALYHLRWGVEEDYKRMKSRLQVEQFSGLSIAAIYQDFHAKILSKNLTQLFVAQAQIRVDGTTAGRKHRYDVNFSRALSIMKNSIVLLLLQPQIEQRFDQIVSKMARYSEAIRPDRSFERKRPKPPKYSMAYKTAW